MKYAVVVLGGGGDVGLGALDGLTPLESATTPRCDALAGGGRAGVVEGEERAWGGRVGGVMTSGRPHAEAGSVSGALARVLGWEAGVTDGQARAAAVGEGLGAADVALRLDLVSVDGDGVVRDAWVEGLGASEAGALVEGVGEAVRGACGEAWEVHAGRAGGAFGACGHVLIVRDGARVFGLDGDGAGGGLLARLGIGGGFGGGDGGVLRAPAGDEVVGRGVDGLGVAGRGGGLVAGAMDAARGALSGHAVNVERAAAGLAPAGGVVIGGEVALGSGEAERGFGEVFGVRGCVVSARAEALGVGRLLGLDAIGLGGDEAGGVLEGGALGARAVQALERYGLVVVYGDEAEGASLSGDVEGKIEVLEHTDELVVGPVMERLRGLGGRDRDGEAAWRGMVVCDRLVSVERRCAVGGAVAFAMGGGWVRSVVKQKFCERSAMEGDLLVEPGGSLMEYFLRSGVKGYVGGGGV